MYVAVKGGEAAIDAAHAWLAEERRGDPAVAEIGLDQIAEQLGLAVDRVMAEASLYDRELAALALKQAQGDIIEAVFLLRAYRTTLPRFGASKAVDTGAMAIDRRISAAFKDLPGGQVLGPTYDYTHRLLDFVLAAGGEVAAPPSAAPLAEGMPRVLDLLADEGLIEREHPPADETGAVPDLTREPLAYPAGRALRLQGLARGDEGFLLSLAYSTQRGYGRNHPFAGEIRQGTVTVEVEVPELGFAVEIGEIAVTECQMINQFKGDATRPAQFTRGYGLVFGRGERKAMAMALVDRALRAEEFGEAVQGPAQDEEFVLSHADNVEASGFVQHLKLPHYVDFQAELQLVRALRALDGKDRREAAE
ncbi:carbon-phosphorus lyase complex subunit PhnI [Zavarzinia compransoris]|uniref:Carbon-phosphorus lyase complex subunit PhnI n=1 Tax=Zavarzinia compransoris TaxID=1264899 RepID=A0A317ED88_9PROT|nr:carbon-phosphorus lyase complex subunit PhnI [Zavarzinia compransoris]PWR23323.1 carbon-phosphorus lyase complex subunit PhnI [Zavarzinia compransoris]TDP46105.1 alpha-D-ribose 1-methylphosphonate 5-triphosphate synthase subunit PhnI [Zavarzinia compransoris]